MASNPNCDTQASTEIALKPCPHCGRTFHPDTLAKHAPICGKVLKKRNVFDSSRQRLEGNVLFGIPPIEKKPPQDAACGSKLSPTKPLVALSKKRCTFSCELETEGTSTDKPVKLVMATPAAKTTTTLPTIQTKEKPKTKTEASGASTASNQANSVKRSLNRGLERCPHCERSFNRKAFDNHVDWCKKQAVIASYTSVNSNEEILKAKKRMEARFSYKPPTPKTKRAIAPQVNNS